MVHIPYSSGKKCSPWRDPGMQSAGQLWEEPGQPRSSVAGASSGNPATIRLVSKTLQLQCPQTLGEGWYVSCSCSFALCQKHSGDGAAQWRCRVESGCTLCSLPALQTCCHCFTPSSGLISSFPVPLHILALAVSYILSPVINCTSHCNKLVLILPVKSHLYLLGNISGWRASVHWDWPQLITFHAEESGFASESRTHLFQTLSPKEEVEMSLPEKQILKYLPCKFWLHWASAQVKERWVKCQVCKNFYTECSYLMLLQTCAAPDGSLT